MKISQKKNYLQIPFALAAFAFLFILGCGSPKFDIESEEGRQAIIEAANKALSEGNCIEAINIIDPLYASKYTNNTVRLVRASAYSCYAGVNYFGMLTDLTSKNLVGGEFWVSMTQMFPYSDLAGLEAGWKSTDALLSTARSNVFTPTDYQINAGSFNVGSMQTGDRTDDANSYLVLNSMAIIGRTQYRNGAPNSSFHKTVNLPWTSAAAMTSEGCAYASAIVNMVDGLGTLVSQTTGSIKTTMSLLQTTFKSAISAACEAGCMTNCGMASGACTASGSFCPLALRNRASCTAVNTNAATCAATGIVGIVNAGPVSWP